MPNGSDYFGKSCEHRIFSELLKQGFDIYNPLLDNKGIDCVIKKKESKVYITIQIKARKSRWIFNIGTPNPTVDYFILITPEPQEIYLIPGDTIKTWLNGRKKFTFTDRYINHARLKGYFIGQINQLREFKF